MSDGSYANMKIGGTLRKEDALDFVLLCKEEFWSELHSLPKSVTENDDTAAQWIKEQITNKEGENTYFELYDVEARNGEFEDLQTFCRDKGLSYNVTASGCAGAWEPSERWYTPEMGYEEEIVTNDEGRYILQKNRIQYILEEIKKLTLKNAPEKINDADPDTQLIVKRILDTGKVDPIDLIEHWMSIRYPEVPEMPPLIIKED
jgi:hypothetical protein